MGQHNEITCETLFGLSTLLHHCFFFQKKKEKTASLEIKRRNGKNIYLTKMIKTRKKIACNDRVTYI